MDFATGLLADALEREGIVATDLGCAVEAIGDPSLKRGFEVQRSVDDRPSAIAERVDVEDPGSGFDNECARHVLEVLRHEAIARMQSMNSHGGFACLRRGDRHERLARFARNIVLRQYAALQRRKCQQDKKALRQSSSPRLPHHQRQHRRQFVAHLSAVDDQVNGAVFDQEFGTLESLG